VFEYDRLTALEAEVASVETRASGQLFDLSYRVDAKSTRSQGWLIVPFRSHPIPFVVFLHGADDELVSAEQTQEFAPYATGLNQLKIYDSATHLQMFFDSAARADRISWLHSKLG
jgi:hypothetical protein